MGTLITSYYLIIFTKQPSVRPSPKPALRMMTQKGAIDGCASRGQLEPAASVWRVAHLFGLGVTASLVPEHLHHLVGPAPCGLVCLRGEQGGLEACRANLIRQTNGELAGWVLDSRLLLVAAYFKLRHTVRGLCSRRATAAAEPRMRRNTGGNEQLALRNGLPTKLAC
jgi:hypothetical protein